jgi:hypothetical protein
VPTGTAFFGISNVTNLSFSAATTTIGGWTFNAGASNYNFTNGRSLTFNGAGIVIDGGSASVTNNSGGILLFFDTSTAGDASIINGDSDTMSLNARRHDRCRSCGPSAVVKTPKRTRMSV